MTFKCNLVFTLILFIGGTEIQKAISDEGHLSNLRTRLLENYDKNVAPFKGPNMTTVVKFGLALNNQDVDDVMQTMSINAWIIAVWDDEHLQWRKEDYGNLSRIHLSPEDVWIPKLTLRNSITSEAFSYPQNIPLVVLERGVVMWFPPFWGEVPCELNLERWPSDSHSCKLLFSVWSHDDEMVDLQTLVENKDGGVILDNYELNRKWSLLAVSSKKEMISYGLNQTALTFQLTVKRMMSKLMSIVSTSAFALIVVLISSYGIPLRFQTIRLIFHLFVLFNFILFYIILSFIIPSKEETPLIVRYYGKLSLLALFSLTINIFLIHEGLLSKVFDSFQKGQHYESLRRQLPSEELELEALNSHLQGSREQDDSRLQDSRFANKTFSVLWMLNIVASVVLGISFLILYYNMKKAVF